MKRADITVEWQDYSDTMDIKKIDTHPMINEIVLDTLKKINVM
jgi:hypothetical protein